ncbi:FbpB family small basic protein [Halobacillus yeomjeoni]|uniref:FbpB family small basic protein n=1 Tax=Halobacillus yeomjeoni TaxID=311194 RepID=A0A931MUC6_9BACI|nr:FbpB family small basic protein [Halobacillus yeomjeoni]MBH0229410.1 FbpB family small basic protein [Halobacillus yeomjeoni]MCA0983185.1 FbpB family small basic protein [Halobacillus yeomjeoni]
MRKIQSISFEERVKENIRSIKEDQKLMDAIDERIEKRHYDKIKQIPS